jgi:molecular chaperone HtpG
MTKQTHAFQAEVKQILHLVTHSLYSNKEIFLRELVSNASDACDKLRFEALDNAALYEDAPNLEVRVTFDTEAKTITIRDNGIGMSAEEAAAPGHHRQERHARVHGPLEGDQKKDANLIGQFGVGFYSGFIVADRITVETRRAGLPPEQGVRWSSEGTGEFEVETITRAERGTDVILHLRDGEDEFLKTWKLKSIVGKYSDHISLPILMRKEEWDAEKSQQVLTDEWETVNKAAALWARPKSEVTDAQYQEFYKQISYDSDAPLAYTHNRVEGRSEYTQLLYIPAKAPFDLWNRDKRGGVKLYVKRVFIMDDAEALMPVYLRFVKGVIDSADLPLNVSRELLQESRDVKAIREGSPSACWACWKSLADSDQRRRQDQVRRPSGRSSARCSRKASARTTPTRSAWPSCCASPRRTPTKACPSPTTWAHEGGPGRHLLHHRRQPGRCQGQPAARDLPQEGHRGAAAGRPRRRVDARHLYEFEGHALQSVAKGAVDLGKLQDEDEKKQAEAAAETFKPTLERLKAALKDRAKDVRVTTRLVDSPACIVVEEGDMSAHLARMLKQAGQSAPEASQPILEVNAEHALVRRLAARRRAFRRPGAHPVRPGLLAEGGQLEDPAAYVRA